MKGDDGSLWVSTATVQGSQITSTSLARVDLNSGTLRAVALPRTPEGTRVVGSAYGLGSLWLSIEPAGLPIDASLAAISRVDPATGRATWSRSIDMASITIACGQIWGEPITDSEQILRQLDPASGSVTDHRGGPVDQVADGCWHWIDTGIERLWPEPATIKTVQQPADLLFDGQNFWRSSGTRLQRWDATSGVPIGSVLLLGAAETRPSVGFGPEPTIVGGPDSIWLVTRNSLVQIAPPAAPSSSP